MNNPRYDPLMHQIKSGGVFPFTVPSDGFTCEDEKAIKKAAAPDRHRIHSIKSGEKTPFLAFCEKQCDRGMEKNYQERDEYVFALASDLAGAQAVLASIEPPVIAGPEGDPPPSGLARQQWYIQKRLADESKSNKYQYDMSICQATAKIAQIKSAFIIMEHLFNLALARCATFFDSVKHIYLDAVIGQSKNPDLVAYKAEMSSYQLPPVVEPFALTSDGVQSPRQLLAGPAASEVAKRSEPPDASANMDSTPGGLGCGHADGLISDSSDNPHLEYSIKNPNKQEQK